MSNVSVFVALVQYCTVQYFLFLAAHNHERTDTRAPPAAASNRVGLERESGGGSDECRLSEDDNGKATFIPVVCPVATQHTDN